MTRRGFVGGALLAVLLAACANGPALPDPVPFDPTWAEWDALLARHVADGRVDYDALDRAALLRVIARMASADLSGWSRAEQTAFWINAYNALTLRVVLDHPGIASIKDIGIVPYAAFREPVARFRARPDALSLDDVEKRELLGGELWDARTHMAVSCASASCPALQPRAWRAEDLDATFDAAARAFLADPRKNRREGGTLYLSRIFEWYAADFERAAGSVEAWIGRYAPALVEGAPQVAFLAYDWSLNRR